MQVTYKNKALEKLCTDASVATKKYGLEMAAKLQLRLDQLRAADSVEQMLRFHIGGCHKLQGGRKERYAVALVQPYRLIFSKSGTTVQIAKILEIVDYH